MKSFVKNRLIDALLKSIICYAFIHSFFMVLHVAVSGDYETVNGFRILGLNLFFPAIDRGLASFAWSWVFLAGIFAAVYKFLTSKS